MTEKTTTLTLDDINNAYSFVETMADEKYGINAEQVLSRFIVNNPALQELIQKLISEIYKMITMDGEPISQDKIAEMRADNDVDDHLFNVLFGEKPAL